MGLVRITDKNREHYLPQILSLEADAEYPLGADFFKIDHGRDHFQFFRRLGDFRYYAWVERGQVAAVAAGVLRQVPMKNGRWGRVWYLCDLKVHPNFRGQKLPLRLMSRVFLPNYLRCQRGYAISMNSQEGGGNRVARLLKHFRWAALQEVTKLSLWSLDQEDMRRVEPILEKHRGPVSYLSLRGIKDIVLQSTGQPMPILHAQFGELADSSSLKKTDPDAVHMFCSPQVDPLAHDLRKLGLEPSSSATVIAHRMKESHWSWILTSDI